MHFWDTPPKNTRTHLKAPESANGSDSVATECVMTSSQKSHAAGNQNSPDAIHHSPPTHWRHMKTWGVCECLYWWRSIDPSGMEPLLNKMRTGKAGVCVNWLWGQCEGDRSLHLWHWEKNWWRCQHQLLWSTNCTVSSVTLWESWILNNQHTHRERCTTCPLTHYCKLNSQHVRTKLI